ncbi:RNase H family protein [Nitrosomonas sp. Nm58]|uniref:RNase H family protein n=1 Tax=Nitrosomonas sp. Nm58 TaxID=200126 RepID=UPI001C434E3A|nr:RNase H family protein [Nitrosomonas sp. Nm58]
MATPIESLKDTVQVKRFEQTSSPTRLELQTLLWALSETTALSNGCDTVLTVYTDSQNIIGLPGRRAHLEQNDYFSSKNKRLNHYELYQQFYRLNSWLNCRFVKVMGHQASSRKDEIDKLFALVDRASRRALREDCKHTE